jgi:hypothetical protein
MSSKEISFTVPLTMDDIAEALFCLDHEDLFDFICALDLQAADYDFTKRLRDHFIKEINECDKDDISGMGGKVAL